MSRETSRQQAIECCQVIPTQICAGRERSVRILLRLLSQGGQRSAGRGERLEKDGSNWDDAALEDIASEFRCL